mmetsp:Transcript_13628/g.18644  ORF Transcript_13628/g.18644 Transcript_13628/m.18644 type:complete len:88 (-) Transcript_13628:830-1093(-)
MILKDLTGYVEGETKHVTIDAETQTLIPPEEDNHGRNTKPVGTMTHVATPNGGMRQDLAFSAAAGGGDMSELGTVVIADNSALDRLD